MALSDVAITLASDDVKEDDNAQIASASEDIPNPCFLDILDVLTEYQVPSTDLHHVGTIDHRRGQVSSRFGYLLGDGYSARVIRHNTDEDISQGILDEVVVKSGTVVALKKISARPSTAGNDKQRVIPEAFRSIYREIRTCCHPVLRQHENIS